MNGNRGKMDEKKIQKLEKQGRGTGVLSEYIPWITTQDFNSFGLTTRTMGWKTKRIHHFFSNNELNYFYSLEWCDRVIDIREQFPLNREDTWSLAAEKGIKHPTNNVDGMPYTMTTDFLITVEFPEGKKEYARTVKPSDELKKMRVMEKFEIERSYWTQRNIDWGIVTEKEISQGLAANMEWLYSSYNNDMLFPSPIFQSYVDKMKKYILTSTMSIVETTDLFDHELNLQDGTGLSILMYLISHKQVMVDITIPIQTHLLVCDVLKFE
ncbi:heteromeric transposase endonuclease subunit TnsA [Planococcus sp. CPCC 101016]|uniref:TnsA endonuclease N-terminal domain-containing protein n=1 Tax=Planococcus sp. CPCC 101016 TaxID=2599617 RepID=UPI0011B6929D|nr:TnsA endonuclease N-terminal domain-containing protein [Planococcus sp. CPCC 101016]TWT08193.1 heteromeric transposase endonuclease subunit TnsA [Planococcus sp. CPCC 101016]